MDDLYNEVSQDVQKERFLKFWDTNKKLIINVVTVVLVLGAGAGIYTTMNQNAQEKDSLAFMHAVQMAAENKNAEALTHFEKIALEGTSGYALLAKLKTAALKAKEDKAAAIKMYEEIAKSGKTDTLFTAYATLSALGLQLDSMDPATLEEALSSFTEEGHAFRFIALEYAALAAQRQGKNDQARDYLMKIAEADNAPNGLKKRAEELSTLFAQK